MKLYLKRKGNETLEYEEVSGQVRTIRVVSEDGLMASPFHFKYDREISLGRSIRGVYLVFPRERAKEVTLATKAISARPLNRPDTFQVAPHRIVVHIQNPLRDSGYLQRLEREMKLRLLREVNQILSSQVQGRRPPEVTAQMIETEFSSSTDEEVPGMVRFTMTSRAVTFAARPERPLSRFDAALESRYRR